MENARELVEEFEEKLSVKVRRQEGIEERWKVKLNPRADKFRRSELLEKYMVKILFGWDNKKFENEYLKKLERNWQRQKSVSLEKVCTSSCKHVWILIEFKCIITVLPSLGSTSRETCFFIPPDYLTCLLVHHIPF